MLSTLLPTRCFISHAYADADLCERLIRKLSSGVEPVVFPPITVKPTEFVSDRLIEALLQCDGLIYLSGGRSSRSFWVALEREYARRAGKPIFAADPVTFDVVPENSAPLDLAAFASYCHGDHSRVREISAYLNRERYFDLWVDIAELKAGSDWQREISGALVDRLKRGGYVIVFWSHKAKESKYMEKELELATRGMADFNDRVLFALLDDCPVPALWTQYQEPAVQLYGDEQRSATQRLDDLVVRLYWLIHRKTKLAQ